MATRNVHTDIPHAEKNAVRTEERSTAISVQYL